jgi:16S rRNA (guanine527-N7)-methyltransferase
MRPESFQTLFKVSRETMAAMEKYAELLLKWQRAINLVSPNTISDLWLRHFADSAQLAQWIPQNCIIADLGSGAGFPGLILSILRPDLEIHLIESDERKGQFLKTVSRETLSKACIHIDRVERILPTLNPNIITARALASLTDLFEYCEPAAQKNPALKMLFLKGKRGEEECQDALKFYRFSFETSPSMTDSEAMIFRIENLLQR